MSHLTLAYMTSREDPKIQWFFDSLRQQEGQPPERLVIVDFFRRRRPLPPLPKLDGTAFIHTEPKPTIWQGSHRITKEDWWATSNARNTALCLAPDGWIAYVDDVSVLLPGWLKACREAMGRNRTITMGAYKKVKNLVVEAGLVKSYTDHSTDSRWSTGSDQKAVESSGDKLFGCSLVGPVESFLCAGGWPEFSDGLSFEDVLMGIVLGNAGVKFMYDRRMTTYESEEAHFNGKVFHRRDKGVSPNDKSHAALNKARGIQHFDNWMEGGIRKLREDALAGKPWPACQIPQQDWYDGQPIAEMVPP